MKIKSLRLYNFRCFDTVNFNFIDNEGLDKNIVFFLIIGKNGCGKTSLLESIYYSCYLKSFKTNLLSEIIAFNKNEFSITVNFLNNYHLEEKLFISLDLQSSKKLIRLNQNKIFSYKDIYNIFRVISINNDDLKLIQEGPNIRRNFIDHIISVIDDNYLKLIYKYKKTLENRNAILLDNNFNLELYYLWSEKLLNLSLEISNLRVKFLNELVQESKKIVNLIFNTSEYKIDINYNYYQSYNLYNNFEEFLKSKNITLEEKIKKRSIFGAHLDDYQINLLHNKVNINSRIYASRGQQKLIVIILKLAQIVLLNNYTSNKNTIILIDDFLSDLDEDKLKLIINILPNFACQIFIASPTNLTQDYFNKVNSIKTIILRN